MHPAAILAGEWWAARLAIPELADACRDAIATRVDAALRGASSWDWYGTRTDHEPPVVPRVVVIEHDYDPHYLWADVAMVLLPDGSIGDRQKLFPAKTKLRIFADRLEPKEGYGNWTAHIAVPSTKEVR